jgi:flagellar hook-associated protein 1 FlgK
MVFAEPPGTAANGFSRIVGVNPAVISAPWRLRDGTSVATIGSIAQNNAIPRAVVDSFERVQPFGTGAGSSGLTLTGYAGSLIVAQATAKNGASEALQARERLNEQFERRYSGESAVNVDRELALMLEIQNSYAASAKVLTAARQLMDELLAMMR